MDLLLVTAEIRAEDIMSQPVEMKMKICMLGDGAVGKTCLMNRFVNNMFSDDYLVTIGTRTSKKKIQIPSPDFQHKIPTTFIIWDIMGQISFRKLLHPTYLKGAKGAILVCDLTRRETLKHLDDWLDSLFVEGCVVPTVFIANKCDREDDLAFGLEEIERVASIYDSPFFITSARTGENVEQAFIALGQQIIANKPFEHRFPVPKMADEPWTFMPMGYDLQMPR